jgi:hypothetical protein
MVTRESLIAWPAAEYGPGQGSTRKHRSYRGVGKSAGRKIRANRLVDRAGGPRDVAETQHGLISVVFGAARPSPPRRMT